MSDVEPRSESRIAAAEKEIEELGSRIRELKSEIEQLREHLANGMNAREPYHFSASCSQNFLMRSCASISESEPASVGSRPTSFIKTFIK